MADLSCCQEGEPSPKAVTLNLLITVDNKQNLEEECEGGYESEQERPCSASIPLQQECCCCCAPPPPPPPRSQKSCCCCPPPRSPCPQRRPCSQPAVLAAPCPPQKSLVLPCGCLALFDGPQSSFATGNVLGTRGKNNNVEVQCNVKKMVEKGVCDEKPPCNTAECQTLNTISFGAQTTATTSIPTTKSQEGPRTQSKTNLSRSRSKTTSSKTGLSRTASSKVSKSKQLGGSKPASKSCLTQTEGTYLSKCGMVKRDKEGAPRVEVGEGENPMLTESQKQMALSTTTAEQREKLDEELENDVADAVSEDAEVRETGDQDTSQGAGPETEEEKKQAEEAEDEERPDGDLATGESVKTGRGGELGEGIETGKVDETGKTAKTERRERKRSSEKSKKERRDRKRSSERDEDEIERRERKRSSEKKQRKRSSERDETDRRRKRSSEKDKTERRERKRSSEKDKTEQRERKRSSEKDKTERRERKRSSEKDKTEQKERKRSSEKGSKKKSSGESKRSSGEKRKSLYVPPAELNFTTAPKALQSYVDLFLKTEAGVRTVIKLAQAKRKYEKKCKAVIAGLPEGLRNNAEKFFTKIVEAIQVKFPEGNTTEVKHFQLPKYVVPILTEMKLNAVDELKEIHKYHSYIVSVSDHMEVLLRERKQIVPEALVEIETQLQAEIVSRFYPIFLNLVNLFRQLSETPTAGPSPLEYVKQLRKLILTIYVEVASIDITFNNTLTSLHVFPTVEAQDKYRKMLMLRKAHARHSVTWAARCVATSMLFYYLKRGAGE